MKRYEYRGQMQTIKQLSEMSGIAAHTLRDRLRRGFSIEEAVKVLPTKDSVREFCEASWYRDWIGMSTSDLYSIYWKWCTSHQLPIVSVQCFTRHIMKYYPGLKTVPTRRGDKCYRIIRMR